MIQNCLDEKISQVWRRYPCICQCVPVSFPWLREHRAGQGCRTVNTVTRHASSVVPPGAHTYAYVVSAYFSIEFTAYRKTSSKTESMYPAAVVKARLQHDRRPYVARRASTQVRSECKPFIDFHGANMSSETAFTTCSMVRIRYLCHTGSPTESVDAFTVSRPGRTVSSWIMTMAMRSDFWGCCPEGQY